MKQLPEGAQESRPVVYGGLKGAPTNTSPQGLFLGFNPDKDVPRSSDYQNAPKRL